MPSAGDITVSPSHGGYLLSRVIIRPAFAPWWEFVGTEMRRGEALGRALQLARLTGHQAWFFDEGQLREITEADVSMTESGSLIPPMGDGSDAQKPASQEALPPGGNPPRDPVH